MTQTSRRASFLLRYPRSWQGFREVLAPSLPPPSGRTVMGTESKVTGPSGTTLQAIHGDDLVALTMLWIPPGRFWMGSPSSEEGRTEAEGPQHLVQLEGFFLSQTPITQAQWRTVARWQQREGERWGQELKTDPSRFDGKLTREPVEDRPVEEVYPFPAKEFCSRLSQRTGRSYTLPSEAQWEYSCRAGTPTPFHFGTTITPELANYNGTYTYGDSPKGKPRWETTPVGSFPANHWGLQDMHGNVYEWCLDHWHDSYKEAPCNGSAWLDPETGEDAMPLLRGGSWGTGPRACRSAFRLRIIEPDIYSPVYEGPSIGFRVVCLPQGRSS